MITADEVVDALHPLLYDIVRLSDRVRLVGTASSALRGIELPVGDVDVLAKDRETVDELVTVSGSPPATLIETPFGYQYLADHRLGGVPVQFSTVESNAAGRKRLAECVGEAPWRYFSLGTSGWSGGTGRRLGTSAASDLMRGRDDRWRPIAAHLLASGFDLELLSQAVLGFPQPMLDELQRALSG